MANLKLNVSKRDGLGKNKVNKLREEKLVPGVIYSRGLDTVAIEVVEKELEKIYLEAGTNNIIDLMLDGEKKPALIKEIQRHPFKNQYLHVDFHGVRMDEVIRVMVPIVIENREKISAQPSVLMQLLTEVEVECLPGDIPGEIVLNVENMEIGDNIFVEDLEVFKDEKINVLSEADELICNLTEPKEEVIEEDAPEVDAAEVPTVEETEEPADAE